MSYAQQPNGYNDRTYVARKQRLRREVGRLGLPCALCGGPIDVELKHPHPQSFSADHVASLEAFASDPALRMRMLRRSEIQPSHLSCNARRRHADTRARYANQAGSLVPVTTRSPAQAAVLSDGYRPCAHHTIGDRSRPSCPHSRSW